MTVSAAIEAQIPRLHHAEKWPIETIARELGVHHSVVRRVLAQSENPAVAAVRPSILDPHVGWIEETLERHPRLHASRLWVMARERGYRGSQSHFRRRIAQLRPRPKAEAYLRLRTLPGEQAQVDWAHFGTLRIGQATRRLLAFVMVLSWSRRIFLRFFLDQKMPSFLRGHVGAFEAFAGVPRRLLYDNLKSVVLERIGDAIHFHPEILQLAAHYRFEPRAAAPARGNEKGRVERAIRYIRTSFFPARRFRGIEDLNAQAADWCRGEAAERRCPEDRSLTVGEAFEQERERLLALPGTPYPTEERLEVSVRKTPYLRFDQNDYSVPHDRVRRTLVLRATLSTVRIFDGTELVATHPRTFDKGRQIERPEHVRELERAKRRAREGRGLDRLQQSVPQIAELMGALAQRGQNLGSATVLFLRLLDTYGPRELAIAVAEAADREAPHPNSVRLILERRVRERLVPPPRPLDLPDDPRVRDLVVTPHDLAAYDPQEPTDDTE